MFYCLLIAFQLMAFVKSGEHTQRKNPKVSTFPSDENQTTVEVIISQSNGTDSPSCINGTTPCKSLQYAYNGTVNYFSNSTKRIVLIISDESYVITDPLFMDIPSRTLEYLEISTNLSTTVLSKSPDAVISIGCNNTYGNPCIGYSVIFKNLKFKHFGSLYPSVIMLLTAKHVGIFSCEFLNNDCSAINSLDTPVQIVGTRFIENRGNGDFRQSEMGSFVGFPNSNLSSGGATAFIFQYVSNITLEIKSCVFHKNSASLKYQLPFIDHSVNDTEFPRVGGGMVLLFMLETKKNQIFLSDNNFTTNHAYSAGGLGVLTESSASFNSIILHDCHFEGNHVTSTSGGILFAIWDNCIGNKMIINGCHFYNNSARFAGGIKLLLNSAKTYESTPEISNLEIKRSKFCSNYADTGSAMHLVFDSLYQQNFKAPVVIENSTFCQHENLVKPGNAMGNSSLVYGGTILTHRIDIEFRDKSYVTGNKAGCGLYASNANVFINGHVVFSGNTAISAGGAMGLADVSRLVFYPGSHLRFEDNYSGDKGGAIAVTTVGMPELTYVQNPFCFLQYIKRSVPYSKWNMTLEFIKNGAALKGGAVFINTLTSCLWNEYPPHHSFSKALRWNNKFIYDGNFVDAMFDVVGESFHKKEFDVDIATDTSVLVLEGSKQVSMSPGESVSFRMIALDELRNPIHSVATANVIARFANGTPAQNHLVLTNKYYVLTPFNRNTKQVLSFVITDRYYKEAFEDQSITHTVQFSDKYSSFAATATIDVVPVACRPGFYFDKSLKSCECDTRLWFVNRCLGSTVLVKEGYWVTNQQGKLNAIYCPPGYCNCTRPRDNLTGCVYDSVSPGRQCHRGRKGKLCGSCNTSLGLAMHTGECIPCKEKAKTIGILVIVVLSVVVISVMVVYLNPSFSTKLRGPTFYAQMLPYFLGNQKMIFYQVSSGIASFTALGGPAGLPFDGCLSEAMDKLDVNALTYLFAFAVLLVLCVVYVLDRFYVLHFTRDSPFQAFWILLVGIYVFFSETSLMFYYCVPIGTDFVFFYDGSLACYQGRHLIMILASSIVLLFFVLLPPLFVVLICAGVVTVPLQVVDALTKGLRDPVRWWWSIDLIRRLVFVAVYVFVPYESVKRVVFIIISVFVLALHAHCQPYRSNFSNISETFLLLSISVLATLQITDDEVSNIVAAVVFMVTFLYISGLFLFLLVQFIRRRLKGKQSRQFQEFQNDQTENRSQRSKTPERITSVLS